MLHVAAGLGQAEALKLLVKQLGSTTALINDCDNDDGATPLHAAAMGGHTVTVQLLLSQGANAGIAGVDGTLAWELVPTADASASSTAKQQPAAQKQRGQQQPSVRQRLEDLQQQLKDAAAKAGTTQATRSSKAASSSSSSTRAPSGQPVEDYSEQFRQLSVAEQNRKIDGFAKASVPELKDMTYLSTAAKAAIAQVGLTKLLGSPATFCVSAWRLPLLANTPL